MNEETNAHTRAALDQATSSIQAIGNAFSSNRSDHAVRNDLVRAREHLTAAVREISDAIGALVP